LKEHLEITISNNNHNQPRKEKERHQPHGRAPHCPTPTAGRLNGATQKQTEKPPFAGKILPRENRPGQRRLCIDQKVYYQVQHRTAAELFQILKHSNQAELFR
jgi:hypothetical protein